MIGLKKDNEGFCPYCGISLQGEPIPIERRPSYGNFTHFSRKIGIYNDTFDRTDRWLCRDCGGEWDLEAPLINGVPSLGHDPSNPRNRGSRIVGRMKIGSIDAEIPIAWSRDDGIFMEEFLNSTKNGWLFLDNQTDFKRMGTNTILFDYNALNGQMYDRLNNSLYSSEMNESLNIQIATPDGEMNFRICSVYCKGFDEWRSYRQSFYEEKDKQEFVDYLRKKNELNQLEMTNLSTEDRFLTISINTNVKGSNLVVHARLITDDQSLS
ncbi:hypothetical protein P4U99_07545 [Brevibacillus agri]|uniref:hypothetical protein n=1 Tax=Brevibacillus TaxID=55080 RepID=UPI002E1D4C23|nr:MULTISPECIES: hypothetical protein [Brevibacillus]MED1643042.1 hypothetical protein [Brevibacillus agri]MED2011162.1 hypothetical protein [Brevibacillus borstelensis]MED1653648.1 hypothetical protein [Brevibacillus agri]MED1687299.1 hypothetical protein [Brevibacillus agri]MED1693872.1 hypothetical protein [Brevibacillus agri]